jgi:hypothetical protein
MSKEEDKDEILKQVQDDKREKNDARGGESRSGRFYIKTPEVE